MAKRPRPRTVQNTSDVAELQAALEQEAARDRAQSSPEETERTRKADLHAKLLKWFQADYEADAEQRTREAEHLRFNRAIKLSDQWPTYALEVRGHLQSRDKHSTPQRPCVMVNKVKMPVEQIVNEARQSRFAMLVKARGNGASKQEAELRQGLIRAREVDSNATVARMSALERAIICGRGFYRIVKEYANDGDFDMDLSYAEIPDQSLVVFDAASTQRDKSDASRCFVFDVVSEEEFIRKWGRDTLPPGRSDDGFGELAPEAQDWVGEKKTYRVAECYYVEYKTAFLIVGPDGQRSTVPELPEGYPADAPMRKVDQRIVKWCLLSATAILDEAPWEGRYIPVIPVIGSVHKVPGEPVVYKGVVADAMDPNRIGNYMRSAQVETVALSTRAPYIADPRQIFQWKELWDRANTANLPYLPALLEVNGVPLPHPKRNVEEPPIQAITMTIREADADVQSATGRHGPSLGQVTEDRSGKALRELKMQGEISSAHFMENMATISIPHDGRIMNDLLAHIYDVPGRIARLVGDTDHDEEEVILGEPMYQTPDGPVPAAQGQPPQPPQQPGLMQRVVQGAQSMLGMGQQQPAPPEQKLYRLTKEGQYQVTCALGKGYQVQREENADVIQSFMEAAPDLAASIIDIAAENIEGPMGEKLAKRFRSLNPQLAGEDEDQNVPPQIQAQVQQLMQQNEELQGLVQQLQAAEQAEQAKIQGQIQLKREGIQAEFQLLQLKVKAEMAKVRLTLQSKEEIERLDAAEGRWELEATHRHDLAMKALDAELLAAEQQRAATAAIAQTALKAETDVAKQDRQAANGMRMTAMKNRMTPRGPMR